MFSRVIVDLAIDQPLDYAAAPDASPLDAGALCVVPVGRRQCVGVCVEVAPTSAIATERIRPITRALVEVAGLDANWLELTRFAADYYQHGWGEVAIPALPPMLRSPPGPRFASVLRRLRAREYRGAPRLATGLFELNTEQRNAAAFIGAQSGFVPVLLFGVTGSGKTAVYLESIAQLLEREPDAQCLLLVPEINLTPQLIAQVTARFPRAAVASMHSALSERDRSAAWLAAHECRVQIVVGTRLSIFASLPRLRLIVVDEEQDTSYKAGDGVRFSARDLAVKRAQAARIPVVLGSATPSLETWSRVQAGRYGLLRLSQRVEARAEPAVELIDFGRDKQASGVSASLAQALTEAVKGGEQGLVFINRRGYAPVLACAACGWLSGCRRCSVFAAFHKIDSTLRCHHCGWQAPVPQRCPTCGNQDLDAIGHGTQRIEEGLRRLLPDARIARIDRDTTRRRGAAQTAFEAVHTGATDVLVGTQMIVKGHDFQRIAVVGVLNVDAQLMSHDFRAPERLFATLMQVAGRAGRAGRSSRVLVQTRYPGHPLFGALARFDYEGFARSQLAERRAAAMPPYVSQALLSAEARQLDAALTFLAQARETANSASPGVRIYDPVPMPLAQVGGMFRAQLLVEAAQRGELQAFLRSWLIEVRALAKRHRPRARWRIEVDPLEI